MTQLSRYVGSLNVDHSSTDIGIKLQRGVISLCVYPQTGELEILELTTDTFKRFNHPTRRGTK